jgi:hypothetical protein
MSSFKTSWKNYLLSNPDLDISNNYFMKIRDLADPSSNFEEVFEIVSKNPGISFIALNPSESLIQLFHHCQVFGGSWASPTKSFVGILGANDSARPVQIILKSIKTIKTKSFSFKEIIDHEFSIKNFEDPKQKKVDFQGRNMMPIPHVLSKAYLSLEKVDPNSVAQAFYITMKEYDMKTKVHDLEATTKSDLVYEDIQDGTETMKENTAEEISSITEKEDAVVPSGDKCSSTFIHILQFCHLCFMKKIQPILYSVTLTSEINLWFESLSTSLIFTHQLRPKCQSIESLTDIDSEDSGSSPDQKVSRKDQVFINTMLKLHDSMDRSYREKSDKEPSFSHLEEHQKKLILNASAPPPFTAAATTPTEFYATF